MSSHLEKLYFVHFYWQFLKLNVKIWKRKDQIWIVPLNENVWIQISMLRAKCLPQWYIQWKCILYRGKKSTMIMNILFKIMYCKFQGSKGKDAISYQVFWEDKSPCFKFIVFKYIGIYIWIYPCCPCMHTYLNCLFEMLELKSFSFVHYVIVHVKNDDFTPMYVCCWIFRFQSSLCIAEISMWTHHEPFLSENVWERKFLYQSNYSLSC